MTSPGKAVRRPRTHFARTDVTTPGSGLFRIAEKGKPKLEATEVIVEHDGVEVAYISPYRLGAEEWKVLLAIAALAGVDGSRFRGPEPTLWDHLLTEGFAAQRDALRIRTTAYALLRELNLADSGASRKALSGHLRRLSSVTQQLRKGDKVMSGARLLSYAHDEESGELAIGISPQMARAILGESKQYVRISLAEVRRLDPLAVLLHAFFSARIRPGTDMRFKLETLIEVAYGPEKVSPATRRKRQERVRDALLRFNKETTWEVSLSRATGPRGTAIWNVLVHRIDHKALAAWEARAANLDIDIAPSEYLEAPDEDDE